MRNNFNNFPDLENNDSPVYEPGKVDPSAIQRWCIVRKYGDDPGNPYLKIEIAYANDSLLQEHSRAGDEYFSDHTTEELSWWQDDVEIIQEPLSEFKEKLMRFRTFPDITSMDDLVIEEGMVFLYIHGTRLIHYTYQARRMSETIYRKLLGREDTELKTIND